ncbi:MAG: TonB family protein [candidate division Zixibacteria bacterium]|nr:TonB family protein [candidate division Zixibacteria bacterium]
MDTISNLIPFGLSATALAEIGIGSVAKVSVILTLALLAELVWRHRTAATRHLILTLGLLSTLFIPIGSALWIAFDPTSLPVVNGVDLVQRAAGSVALGEIAVTPNLALPSWWTLAVVVWLAGVVLLAIRELAGYIRTRTVVRQAHEIDNSDIKALFADCLAVTGIRRPVRLLAHSEQPVPFTCGLFRPVVVLSARELDGNRDHARRVILHELAHVERLDSVANAVAGWVSVLFWFHPLVWLATRRLHIEQERACDDRVVHGGESAAEYAEFLLGYARDLRKRLALLPEGMTFVRARSLRARIHALLDPQRHMRRTGRVAMAVCVTTALAGVLLLSCVRTPTAEKNTDSQAKAAAIPSPDEFIEVDDMPAMVKSVDPEYPQALADSGVSGTVWIRALVDTDGTVAEAHTLNPNKHDAFNTAAIQAAYKNEFTPAQKNGKPIAVWVTYKVTFKMSADGKDEDC